MLLNYWRDPSTRNHRDFSRVSRTLRQVKRQDLARWLCGGRPSCFSRDGDYNGTNDASSMTAQMQVIPIYASRALPDHESSIDPTLDAMIWIYIALAVSATAAVLLCVHYLFKKFRKPSQYISLADKRSVQHACRYTDNNEGVFPCSKKNRYPQTQSGCGCSSN
ncbi:uncharacterized protein LOC125500222 [Athalia rosae]|uniref:uncharacterized protein LOC125500222 n=1 Tax=Athalia rosae TaxID=37344 RepID=UPI0020343320|nr:uncharacterized protein LOC125500222 [Athalia rosae]